MPSITVDVGHVFSCTCITVLYTYEYLIMSVIWTFGPISDILYTVLTTATAVKNFVCSKSSLTLWPCRFCRLDPLTEPSFYSWPLTEQSLHLWSVGECEHCLNKPWAIKHAPVYTTCTIVRLNLKCRTIGLDYLPVSRYVELKTLLLLKANSVIVIIMIVI